VPSETRSRRRRRPAASAKADDTMTRCSSERHIPADPAGLIDRWAEHGEVEPLAAAEIAEQQIADMERQIEIGGA